MPIFSICVTRLLFIVILWVDDGFLLELAQFISETCTFHLCLCVLIGFWLSDLWVVFPQDSDKLWIGLVVIVKRVCTLHWLSVLTFSHCLHMLSIFLLRLCWFVGFWLHYLVLVVTIGGFRFCTDASFDIVGRLFVMNFGFCFTLLISCSVYQLCGFHCLSCDLYFWFTVLFFCSTAREKLAFGYFSKANRMPAIFGLTRSVEFAWTTQIMIYDVWVCCLVVTLIVVVSICRVFRTCNMHIHYVIGFVCSSIMVVIIRWTVPILILGIRIFKFLVLFF